MAEDLDYVPMPDNVVGLDREDLGRADQGRHAASRSSPCERHRIREKAPRAAPSSRRHPCMVVHHCVTEALCAARLGLSRLLPEESAGEAAMQSAGRRSVVDVALNGDAGVAIGAVRRRAKMLDRLRWRDALFRQLTRAAAVAVLILLGGVIVSLVIGSLPALRAFGFGFLVERALESGHREVRRAGADLRHPRHLVHRHADRGAGRPLHRDLPHRALPAVAAPADRHRDRAARRHSQHHLRHLGPVRVRAVPAADLCSRS